ncbi:hypothetical protein [Clostridium sp. OS1-26]|uniref:hypothetical protein n=1 Tax=Clostridium sp. OS1-26 TaxID=3070681 RepID=UPI0027DF32EE|nr:hypothetical protein [Clostridium sp. OS1-26]WML34801.1 hypothetical protein RCG18_26710 [Clostridium sp. OS1-26]
MKHIEEELKKIKVIDREDIIKFKNYIYKKYPENTAVKNAKILSDTIHQIIYTKLDGIPEDFKLSIKIITLKNTLGSSKNLITLYDIFDSCVIDENLRTNFTRELISWVNVHSNTKIEMDEAQLYLQFKYDKEVNSNTLLKEDMHIESKEMPSSNAITIKSEKIPLNSVMPLDNSCSSNFKPTLQDVLSYLRELNFRRGTVVLAICVFSIGLYTLSKGLFLNVKKAEYKSENYIFQTDKIIETSNIHPNIHMPVYMRYKKVNEEKLKNFLDKRNSLLTKEPYFSTILSVSKEFNLNPIVLFSVAGQEQSFVPKDNPYASKIANNPYNVFHSWKEYNTNIKDSTSIAARTLINLSKNTPEDTDPFLWIGKKYAEDSKWGSGVRSIFEELSNWVN